MWNCTSDPQYVFMPWFLLKHMANFTFYHTLPDRGWMKYDFENTQISENVSINL